MMLLALMAGLAGAQDPPRIDSAYSKLDLDRCERLDDGSELASASWRCAGHGGVPLFVQNGDDRYDLDAGSEGRDGHWGESFDVPGETVEWRIADGKPFAIIYRLRSARSEAPSSSRLVVETIGGARPGCRIFVVDGAAPRANEQAREAADRALGGAAACLSS
jgi:hypothetical protein